VDSSNVGIGRISGPCSVSSTRGTGVSSTGRGRATRSGNRKKRCIRSQDFCPRPMWAFRSSWTEWIRPFFS